MTDILAKLPKYRKAVAAFVTSAFGLALVFGFADPSLEASILAILTAVANVGSVVKATNAL